MGSLSEITALLVDPSPISGWLTEGALCDFLSSLDSVTDPDQLIQLVPTTAAPPILVAHHSDRDIDVIRRTRSLCPHSAILVMWLGPVDPDCDALLAAGADDVVSLDRMSPDALAHAIRFSTGRKEAERRLLDSETRYRDLFEHAPIAYQSLDADGRFLNINEAWTSILGYSIDEVRGTWFGDYLAPGYADAFREKFPQFKAAGTVSVEFQMSHKDGSIRLIEFNGIIGVDECGAFKQTHCILKDVSSARLLEQQLEESRAIVNRLLENSPLPMMIHAEGGEVLQINKTWTELSGYSAEQIKTIYDWTELAYGAHAAELREHIVGLYLIGGRTQGGRDTLTTASGEQRVWDFTSAPLGLLPDGRHIIVSMAADITAQVAIQQQLRRAVRALKTLSWSSRALVHSRSENDLYRSVCAAAVEHGRYKMAWIGLAQDDAMRSIKPVARCGDATDYLDEVSFSWGDEPTLMGTSGMAIRTGKPAVANNMEADGRFARFTAAALARGFGSIAALPIFAEQHDSENARHDPIGALVIIAEESDAFDDEELALLSDVAAELSYGVRRLREGTRKAEIELDLIEANRRLSVLLKSMTDTMGRITEARDPYTQGHQERVAAVATALAMELGLPAFDIQTIEMASLVHDIGKLGVPAEILTKPSKLTDLEFSLIHEHPQFGYEILKDVPFPWPLAEATLLHHERMDGSGYPQGLKGEAIPLAARVIAVADVIEAMASHRPYRAGLGIGASIQEITKDSAEKYDGRVVGAALRLYEGGALERILG